jgi:hypothetical protein
MAVLLRGVARVITAESEHLFYDMTSVAGTAQVGFEETLGSAVACVPGERKNSYVH